MTNQTDSLHPGYLTEWPRLRGETTIDKFATLYKVRQQALTENVLENRTTASTQLSTVDRLHKSLKAVLGQ
jgi:hypothetical protein